jgi:hypothetical protein
VEGGQPAPCFGRTERCFPPRTLTPFSRQHTHSVACSHACGQLPVPWPVPWASAGALQAGATSVNVAPLLLNSPLILKCLPALEAFAEAFCPRCRC